MPQGRTKINWDSLNIQEDEYGIRTPKVLDYPPVSDIVQASREQNFTSPQIQSSNLIEQGGQVTEAPRSRKADPITSTALRYLLSPGTSATEGLMSAGETAQEAKQAFESGDIGGGLLGSIAALVRGGFSAATPAVPALRAFTAGSEIASDIVGKDVVNAVTSPVTTLTKPETLAGKSAAEIGDVAVQALLAKTGQSIYRKVVPVETAKGVRYKDPETGRFIKKEVQNAEELRQMREVGQEKIDNNANAIQEMLARGKSPEDIAKVLNIEKTEVEQFVTKPIEEKIIETERDNLPPTLSKKIKSTAEQFETELKNAKRERTVSYAKPEEGIYRKSTEINTFPEWFRSLGSNKDAVLRAIEKIIEDKGKDKGQLVERVKRLILTRLKGEEREVIKGRSGKKIIEHKIEVPGDIDVQEFLNRYTKGDISLSDFRKAYSKFEKETQFPFGANIERTKAGQQFTFGKETKPQFPTSAKYSKGEGKGVPSTPLFDQPKTDIGQTNLFEKKITFHEALKQTDNYDVRKIANQTGTLPREIAKQFRDLEKQRLVTKVDKGYKPTDEFKILLDDAQRNPQKYNTSLNQLNSNPIGEVVKGLSKAQTLIDNVFQKYVGNRIYRGLSTTVNKLVPEKIKEQIIENYGLPKQYIELKTEAKDAIGRFNDLAKEIADNLKYKSKGIKFTDAEQRRLAQIIKGGVTTDPLLRERATKAINEIKSLERLGKEVETLPIETYNTKLPRKRINELLTAKRKLKQKNNPKLQPKIDDIDRKIKNSFKHGDEGYFKRVYLTKEQTNKFSKYGYYKPTRLDLTSAIARKDIPFEVRKEMGEILTASYPVAKSITLEGKDVSLGRFFEAINEKPDWSSPVERQGFVKMPDSPKLGKLKGRYVEERIANDINDVIRLSSPEYIESFLKGVNSIWKATKTIMNPSTHFRNIYSNSIMLDFSGVPHLDQVRLFKPAIDAVIGRGEYANKFKASRLSQSTFNKAELGQYLDVIAENPREFLDLTLGEKVNKIYGKATLVDTKVGDIMGKVYQAEESIGKAIKFISELEKGKGIKEARTEANKWLFDYGETSKAVNFLRNNPIIGSPFITWTAKALPRIIETAITRPLSFWKYPLIFSAITKYSLNQLNLSDEEWKTIETELPQRMIKGEWLLLPFRDENDKMQMVDLSYILPYKDAYDIMESGWMLATQGETNTGDDLVEGVMGLMNAPVLTTITELKANKNTYTNQPIWNETDTNNEKAQKVFDYLYKLYMPALAPEIPGVSQGGYAYHKMSSVIKGKEDYYGRTFTLAPAISSSFFGVKTAPIEPEKNKERLTYKIQDQISELGRKRNRILRDGGLNRDERITRALEIDNQIDELKIKKEDVGFKKPKEGRILERKIRRYQKALERISSKERRQEIQKKIAELKIKLGE